MDNLNVLVEAKKEYLGQMCLIMTPAMIEVFQEMYNESIKSSKGKQVLIMFQNFWRRCLTGPTPCLKDIVTT